MTTPLNQARDGEQPARVVVTATKKFLWVHFEDCTPDPHTPQPQTRLPAGGRVDWGPPTAPSPAHDPRTRMVDTPWPVPLRREERQIRRMWSQFRLGVAIAALAAAGIVALRHSPDAAPAQSWTGDIVLLAVLAGALGVAAEVIHAREVRLARARARIRQQREVTARRRSVDAEGQRLIIEAQLRASAARAAAAKAARDAGYILKVVPDLLPDGLEQVVRPASGRPLAPIRRWTRQETGPEWEDPDRLSQLKETAGRTLALAALQHDTVDACQRADGRMGAQLALAATDVGEALLRILSALATVHAHVRCIGLAARAQVPATAEGHRHITDRCLQAASVLLDSAEATLQMIPDVLSTAAASERLLRRHHETGVDADFDPTVPEREIGRCRDEVALLRAAVLDLEAATTTWIDVPSVS